MSEATELKPCPFCGGRDAKLWIGLNEFTDGEVHCPCGAQSGNFPSGPEAVNHWNTRAEGSK
jgi:Lar family restriction alleviation protein